ncbi:TIR domain-containing protein [Phormidesmis sp. 146-35]
MTDVFLSYSRKDKAFVQTLHDSLRAQQREIWVDWQAIPLTADWWQEIERGIEGTNTFVFVISPDSVVSDVCRQEIDHAVKHNKRLVPIVHREGFDLSAVHPMLSRHNWLFFRETDEFDRGFASLVQAIETDLEYVRSHTRLTERAVEWNGKQRNESFVLRGDDLKFVEQWLANGEQKTPVPTELQREYIRASRTIEEATQILIEAGQEAEKLVRSARRRAAIALTVLGVALVGAGIAGSWAVKERSDARSETRLERSSVSAMRRFDSNQTDGLLSAMRSGFELQSLIREKSLGTYPASPIWALQSSLVKIRETLLPGRQDLIWGVAYSPDGTLIATGGNDGTLKLWNPDGKLAAEVNSDQEVIWSVAFSPDSKLIATGGSKEGNTRLWDRNGKQVKELEGKQTLVLSVTFSPDSTLIATGGTDGTLKLWNPDGKQILQDRAGKPMPEVGCRQSEVYSVAFSPDSQRMAIGCSDGTLQLWDRDGNPIQETLETNHVKVNSVKFSPDGQQIVTGGEDGTVRLWNRDGKEIRELKGRQGIVQSVALSPDGKLIAAGGHNGNIQLWDRNGNSIDEFKGNQGIIWSIAFSPNSQQIVTGGNNGNASLWDRDSSPIGKLTEKRSGISNVVFSLDGQQVAISVDKTISHGPSITELWSRDGKLIKAWKNDQEKVFTVAFSPDGQQIAIGGDRGTTNLWDREGKSIGELKGEQGYVRSAAFSQDSKLIITGGGDSTTKLWDRDSGKLISAWKNNQGIVWGVALSPDGKLIASVGDDGQVKLWNQDGKQVGEFPCQQGIVKSVTFSPDGKLIATGGNDGNTKLWNQDGKQIGEFPGSQGSVNRVAFSPDGKLIATVSSGGTTQLWHQDGRQIAQFEGGYPSTLSPDWKTIAITETPLGSDTQVVRLYRIDLDLDLDSLLRRACQRLKNYLLYSPDLKDDRDRCAAHLGDWEGERTQK